MWTAPPLTSGLFVLAAFFVAAAVAASARIEVPGLFLAALLVAFRFRVLPFLRITWRRLLCTTTLLAGTGASIALLHSLIAITMTSLLSQALGMELEETLLWDYPNFNLLSFYLVDRLYSGQQAV